MPYRLKPDQETFQVVDGEFAGKTFDKSGQYDSIPVQDAHRFELVSPPADPVSQKDAGPTQSWVPSDPGALPDPDQPSKKGVKANA